MVEYSPGQEAWVEATFADMLALDERRRADTLARETAPNTPPRPGSPSDLRARRDVLIAAIARQIGLASPTALQHRTFDTFLSYYEIIHELQRDMGPVYDTFDGRHRAIWQRDDLVARLRAGAVIEGISYDAETDQGSVNLQLSVTSKDGRIAEIMARMREQRLDHKFTMNESAGTTTLAASFSTDLAKPPSANETNTDPTSPPPTPKIVVIPIIYPGDLSAPPDPTRIKQISLGIYERSRIVMQNAADYRDASIVGIILHETAEAGLIDTVIRSKDRRWLCDGSANYVAWRVARDHVDAAFGQQVYDIDEQLRRHATQQSRVKLARWPAVENQPESERGSPLSNASYAFATRAMFLLHEWHGEDALRLLWQDVAQTPMAKASAKTFARAYQKRYGQKLSKLITAAERNPIPAAPSPPPAPAAG